MFWDFIVLSLFSKSSVMVLIR